MLAAALGSALPSQAQQSSQAQVPAPSQTQAQAPANSARQWADLALIAYVKEDFRTALDAYRKALAGGFANASLYAELAACHAALGDRQAAFEALERGLALGLRMDAGTKSSLSSLHADPRWQGLLARSDSNVRNYRKVYGDPAQFRFITSDVDLFWRVADQLPGAADPAALLDREYLDKGSIGLQRMIYLRIRSGAKLQAALQRFPRYYAGVRPHTLQAAKAEAEVRSAMLSFKTMYAAALFPDIYFVVGGMASGGISTPEGLVIGTELFSRSPDVSVGELDAHWQTVTKSAEFLPSIVVHELMHFQQDVPGNSLLAAVIKEGGADFVASLLVKKNFNEHVYAYGYAHEAQLKQEFAAAMDGASFDGWLYGGKNLGDKPADLGYFMGFRICQAYYKRAADKRQAIADILNVKDARRFLADSGYL